jgi:hypothetical protein
MNKDIIDILEAIYFFGSIFGIVYIITHVGIAMIEYYGMKRDIHQFISNDNVTFLILRIFGGISIFCLTLFNLITSWVV